MADNLAKLAALSPPTESAEPVIAVDLDDVLCQTNRVVAEWHNKQYGTQMDISHFYYFYYWKNPYWGTPTQTFEKVKQFYNTDAIFQARPVPGAREGVQALKDMGYKLVIVTARDAAIADASEQWVEKYFPGLFANLIFTGQFKDAHLHHGEVLTNLTKSQVCADVKAQILIDDSSENAIQCATALPPTPVLLFGDYQWNKRISIAGEGTDEMSFDIRLAAGGGKKFWEEETLHIPEGAPVERVKDWSETVRWIRAARAAGRIC
ncbi:hypothetical protein C8F01DRAFT_1110575 [Mycena amicta]|nr:hypothetical protein C8F01DRAFT_1110575 [Mycena amicta]